MGFITDVLKDLPLSAVMRERIVELESDILKIKEEKTKLEKDFSDLKEEYLRIFDEYEKYRISHENFVEIESMKFKRSASGSYDKTPYCINSMCHNAPMSYIPNMFGGVAICERCKRKVFISQSNFDKLLKTINKE